MVETRIIADGRRSLAEVTNKQTQRSSLIGLLSGAVIDARLREMVPGYNPIIVKLQMDGQPESTVLLETVCRSLPNGPTWWAAEL